MVFLGLGATYGSIKAWGDLNRGGTGAPTELLLETDSSCQATEF
jgi:hypothetical protein